MSKSYIRINHPSSVKDGILFVVNKPEGTYVKVENSGVFLWEELSTAKTKDQLLVSLTKEYDINKEEAEKDIDDFISAMIKADVIKESS